MLHSPPRSDPTSNPARPCVVSAPHRPTAHRLMPTLRARRRSPLLAATLRAHISRARGSNTPGHGSAATCAARMDWSCVCRGQQQGDTARGSGSGSMHCVRRRPRQSAFFATAATVVSQGTQCSAQVVCARRLTATAQLHLGHLSIVSSCCHRGSKAETARAGCTAQGGGHQARWHKRGAYLAIRREGHQVRRSAAAPQQRQAPLR